MTNQKGFTLIEVLVSILIIAIISMSISKFTGSHTREAVIARTQQRAIDLMIQMIEEWHGTGQPRVTCEDNAGNPIDIPVIQGVKTNCKIRNINYTVWWRAETLISPFQSTGKNLVFSPVSDGLLGTNIVVHPNGRLIFAAFKDGGIYRSFDGGKTWSPDPTIGYLPVFKLEASTKIPSIMMAATSDGVMVNNGIGGTWNVSYPYHTTSITHIELSFGGGRIGEKWLANTGNNLAYSIDYGATWSPLKKPVGSTIVYDVAHSIFRSKQRFIASADNGVFFYDPGNTLADGNGWVLLTGVRNVKKIVVSGNDIYLIGKFGVKANRGGRNWISVISNQECYFASHQGLSSFPQEYFGCDKGLYYAPFVGGTIVKISYWSTTINDVQIKDMKRVGSQWLVTTNNGLFTTTNLHDKTKWKHIPLQSPRAGEFFVTWNLYGTKRLRMIETIRKYPYVASQW